MICFPIQFLFSSDWMLLGENTVLFALMPLIGAAAVLFRKGVTVLITGKIVITLVVASGSIATLNSVHSTDSGTTSWGIWLYVVTLVGLMWEVMGFWSRVETRLNKKTGIVINLLVPLLFGGVLLYLWEMLTIGFQVPQVLLPAPSLIGVAFANSLEMLWADFQQTVLKAVLAGFFMGCVSGFVVAVLVDKVPFLQRGLLPLGIWRVLCPLLG